MHTTKAHKIYFKKVSNYLKELKKGSIFAAAIRQIA